MKRVLPDEFKKHAEAVTKHIEEAERSDPTNAEELKWFLINKGIDKRKELESVNDKTGEVKQPRLSTVQVAEIMNDNLTWALFDLEEGSRLTMYSMFEGIYTRNQTIIKRYISYVENVFTERQAEDVIYKISNMTETKELTNERHLIPVNNGIFNLTTNELEPFTSEYVFTTKVATDYKESPVMPDLDGWNVDDWIGSIATYDKEIETLLWQVINDSLNGNYSRKKAIFLVGNGANGKGSFQELITSLVGAGNVATLKINQFDQPFKLSLLEGKTVCIGDDVQAGEHLKESSNFNSVVTGDRVLIERKNKQPYSVVLRMGVIQSTNVMPQFQNKTDGTYRRLVIVPFNADFKGSKDNAKIKEVYIHKKEVLEYVLHKAINMDFEKFIEAEATKIQLSKFVLDNDPIADFKASVFDQMTSNRIPTEMVYQYYKDFCDESGYRPVGSRRFSNEFQPMLSDEWETKTARWEATFKETYRPRQYDKNPMLEQPSNPARCHVNTMLESV